MRPQTKTTPAALQAAKAKPGTPQLTARRQAMTAEGMADEGKASELPASPLAAHAALVLRA